MSIYRAVATITLEFDSEDGLVASVEDARAEMYDYLFSGPSTDEFDVTCVALEDGPRLPEVTQP